MTTTSPAPTAGRFAPSTLDPAQATVIDAWDDDPEDGWMRPTPEFVTAVTARLAPEARNRGWARCTMCGANLRYVCLAEYAPTGECFLVGEDCADNIDFATGIGAKVSDLRAKAAGNRANLRIAAAAQAVLDADAEFATALAALVTDGDDFGTSVREQLFRKGNVSDRQRDGIVKAAARAADRKARAAQRAADEAANPAQPIPADVLAARSVITGEIVSKKWVDNAYGGALKVLVRDDRAFKVWGTAPNDLFVDHGIDTGIRVTFTARVEASPDDPTFGFFARPTKATRL